jgi:3-methylcrotonyl-CoA carboxylase alpha subunit
MGLKDAAKVLMEQAGVPVVPGYHGSNQAPELLESHADEIGYPVLIKARAGGGGKGMRMVPDKNEFARALESAAREAQTSFGDAAVIVEKYITSPRHIEIQVFGDNHENVVHFFERDCSLQRRHQKVIEEAPAPGMSESVRQAMTDAAVKAARAINYSGAGTVEFIADGSDGLRADRFWFMEMNTRLQVEHPVTEAVTDTDLVEWQIRVASGEALPLRQEDITLKGHAVEARVYAEDVPAGFLPASGQLRHVSFAPEARVDTGVGPGSLISPFYDPMIAKVITHADTRDRALKKLNLALMGTHIAGTVTNLDFLVSLSSHRDFVAGRVDTGLIDRNQRDLVPDDQQDVPNESQQHVLNEGQQAEVVGGSSKPSAQDLQRTGNHPPFPDYHGLLAALYLCGINPEAELCGWRLWGDAGHLITMHSKAGSQSLRLVLNQDGLILLQDNAAEKVLCQGTVSKLSASEYQVESDGKKLQAEVVGWAEKSTQYVSVYLNGQSIEFKRTDPLDVATDHQSATDTVVAPMTGIVRQLDVLPGHAVKAGDRLLVLEAMKMETDVESPRDGVIKDILCKVDESVDGGSVLVSLEQKA